MNNGFSLSVPNQNGAHHHHDEEASELRARIAALESRVSDLFNLFGRVIGGGQMPAMTATPMMPAADQPLPTFVEGTLGAGRRSAAEYRRLREASDQINSTSPGADLTADSGV